MDNCKVCGGTEFFKEAGYFFCSECQTQHETKREEILEARFEGTRLTKRAIRKKKLENFDLTTQWTTWEQYNFILIGLTDELIELGVTSEIKLTILQLWAFYLQKTEVAFLSTKKHELPRLAKNFHKKDADIIYGKIESRKRKRSKASSNPSIISVQTSEASSVRELNKSKKRLIKEEYNRSALSQVSDSDVTSLISQSLHTVQSTHNRANIAVERLKYSNHAKLEFAKLKKLAKKLPMSRRLNYQQKHITTQYRHGPHAITPMKLWAIIYLALRIHNQDVHLGDMLRWGREGHLSYYKLDHLLPSEITLTDSDVKLLTNNNEITHKGMRGTCADMAKFLSVREISPPNFMKLVNRYCKELNLPERISMYTEGLVNLSNPTMIFDHKEPMIPNYEGRAMAFIIVVFKVLLGMDGITEYEMSRIAEKINCKSTSSDDQYSNLFSFREWQRYIECRRNILIQRHFATKFKNDSDGFGNTDVYVRFIKLAMTRREEEPEITNKQNLISRELINAMKQCISTIEENCSNSESGEIFPPSFTPQYSYLEQLLENPMYDLPQILRKNFNGAKLCYSTKPKKFIKFAAQFNIRFEIVKSRLHFINKFVSRFEKSKLPSVGEWNASVSLECRNDEEYKRNVENFETQDSFEKLKINKLNQFYYDNVQRKISTNRNEKNSGVEPFKFHLEDENSGNDDVDFGFGDITSEGKLNINSPHDLGRNEKSMAKICSDGDGKIKAECIDLHKKYNLQLSANCSSDESDCPYQTPPKIKHVTRDVSGKFVSKTSENAIGENYTFKEPRKVTMSQRTNRSSAKRTSEFFNSEIESSDESVCGIASMAPEKLFMSSEDYWMYHCIFSRVKPKSFESFESELPVSFQWLLNECADVVEMSTEDLYEQVCFVETYFAHVIGPNNSKKDSGDFKVSQAKVRLCKKKW